MRKILLLLSQLFRPRAQGLALCQRLSICPLILLWTDAQGTSNLKARSEDSEFAAPECCTFCVSENRFCQGQREDIHFLFQGTRSIWCSEPPQVRVRSLQRRRA